MLSRSFSTCFGAINIRLIAGLHRLLNKIRRAIIIYTHISTRCAYQINTSLIFYASKVVLIILIFATRIHFGNFAILNIIQTTFRMVGKLGRKITEHNRIHATLIISITFRRTVNTLNFIKLTFSISDAIIPALELLQKLILFRARLLLFRRCAIFVSCTSFSFSKSSKTHASFIRNTLRPSHRVFTFLAWEILC